VHYAPHETLSHVRQNLNLVIRIGKKTIIGSESFEFEFPLVPFKRGMCNPRRKYFTKILMSATSVADTPKNTIQL
jgi:hypothetical protein